MSLKVFNFLDLGVEKNISNELKKSLIHKQKTQDFDLSLKDNKLTVEIADQTYSCDFLNPKYIIEVKQNYSRSESVYSFLKTIAKGSSKKRLKILDLTAGFGRDLFKFVLAGHEVIAFEKDPLVFSLLKDGSNRFFSSDKLSLYKKEFRLENNFSLELMYKDSNLFLEESLLEQANDTDLKVYDLIYFDPMFDDKQKKAAPKKHMQIIKKSLLTHPENVQKEDVIEKCLKISNTVVLKSSKYDGKKIKAQKIFSFKGFNYYLFK